ncbi:type IV toxin-antitoxin system AbiEi family antitoxin domain-containing protein [Kocuria sp. JC486]|uniref:endonuclease domain-containing protein n=1 Tax=Kocuria sp. JC486 TaxID=1970736 RepID=UPI0014221291|nr:type IV toxin-antitoxin system AbiEi family antitoxin domain-containing protein [Kocuria sp. JC486]NHU85413.1 type IV toxin-antitoxin system AbiEi family antitoxin domain-containing protein [Kocuria sp. JC486]
MDLGVYSWGDLREHGVTRKQLDALLDSGGLQRLRRGWFATPRAPVSVTRAVALGGTLGCLSGCEQHGIWTPNRRLHVMLNPGVPIPTVSGVHLHRLPEPTHRPLASVLDCLRASVLRHDTETALTVIESAVNVGLIRESDARDLICAAPASKRNALSHFTLGAGSGSETRVRYFLQQRRFAVRTQVSITGVGRVDLLVGESLIVECDSEQHHAPAERYRMDRIRDMASRDLGYTTVRLSYDQIWYSWALTQRSLLAELATGRHRRPPVPRM